MYFVLHQLAWELVLAARTTTELCGPSLERDRHFHRRHHCQPDARFSMP